MPYQQITLAQFRNRLKSERLGAQANTFYTTAELNAYIQESLRVWNSLTGYWKTSQIVALNNQPWYVINLGMTSSLRVLWRGKPLTPTSLFDMDTGRPFWESEGITGGGDIPSEPTLFAIGAINLIAIWPFTDGDQVIVEGLASTPVLQLDTDYLDIGNEELSLLLDYCEHLATFKEGGAEWEATLPLYQNFIAGAASRNGMLLKSSLYRKFLGGDVDDQKKNPLRMNSRVGAR